MAARVLVMSRFDEDREIYQAATMGALLGGVYDGSTSIRELLCHGDFGLGTFDALDGEMVMVEAQCFQLRSDGSATIASGDQLVPFAAVTRFHPQHRIDVATERDRRALTHLIDTTVGSSNLMVAVRIRGEFSAIDTRAVTRQHRPYRRFTEAAGDQRCTTLQGVDGELVGFRMPGWVQGISVAGYHLHFLSADRQRGGHALDYRLTRGVVDLSVCSDLHLRMPTTTQFENADLDNDDTGDEIRRTEGF